jgi:hypothetical protein
MKDIKIERVPIEENLEDPLIITIHTEALMLY